MGKGHKTVVLAPASTEAGGYRAGKALEMRRKGETYEAIAAALGLASAWDASQLVSIGYAQIQAETGDQMRSASEDRLLDIIRRAHADLAITSSQTMRNALYKIVLDADSRLSRLYGLDLPAGLPDALEAGDGA